MDLTQILTVEEATAAVAPLNPDLILCAGAMTYVDGCEEAPELASRANTYGPAALAEYAHNRSVQFVYFSSDYVFGGTADQPGPYAETSGPHPLSVYGRTKLDGERMVLRVHPEALVVRTSWVYGPDAAGKNFISSLVRALRAGKRVQVPSDQISTPTFNRDLARVTLKLLGSECHGIVHVTGPERMSRLELAQTAAKVFDCDVGLLTGVSTDSLRQKAKRPLLSGLISHRLRDLDHELELRPLLEGLKATAATLES